MRLGKKIVTIPDKVIQNTLMFQFNLRVNFSTIWEDCLGDKKDIVLHNSDNLIMYIYSEKIRQ